MKDASDNGFKIRLPQSTKFDFQSYRHTGPRIENASEYTYSAKIKFFKIDQQVAGKYSCVSATREFALKGKEENLQSNLHLFVPGASSSSNDP
jgi:hypothetical protein